MQTASSDDDWRPGFAKRAPNFAEVCERAERWRWQPGETVARLAAAVLKGTPTLTLPQRLTLLLYVEHLNQDRLEQDIACVWPSSALIADYLGCSESTARAHRRALEAAGFMVRDYTRANRPAGVEAYDLAPLVGRLDEMEAADAAVREAAQARRALYSEAVVFQRRNTARAPEHRRLEQSHHNESLSVREEADAPTARGLSPGRRATRAAHGQISGSSTQHRDNRQDSAFCSPKGASGFGGARPAPSLRAEMVRQELLAAVQVCPRLAPLVPATVLADPASACPADAARIAAAADEWLPEAERNNGLSVAWGWRRHGPRIIAMLAIALEDPSVRDRCKYFGWMATRDPDGAPDLRLNFARIMRAKGEIPAAPAAAALMDSPGAEDPKWQAIDAELQRIVRQGPYGSWFGRIGFHGVIDGVLNLSTLSGVAADRIKRDFVPAILEAAEAAGEGVERVVITVRRSQ
jgi:hypothetical protein